METYSQYVTRLFDSWTVLRLGIIHESGGRTTREKISTLTSRLPEVMPKFKYKDELSDFLEDILDDELNIICEDGSHEEIADLLFEGYKLLRENKINELKQKILELPTGCDLDKCQGQVIVPDEVEVEEPSDCESESDEPMT